MSISRLCFFTYRILSCYVFNALFLLGSAATPEQPCLLLVWEAEFGRFFSASLFAWLNHNGILPGLIRAIASKCRRGGTGYSSEVVEEGGEEGSEGGEEEET